MVQKLLDVCSDEQRTTILVVLTQDPATIFRISLDSHGTRAVQKLIETLKTHHQIALVMAALRPGLLDLMKEINGKHVIQHCLTCLWTEETKAAGFPESELVHYNPKEFDFGKKKAFPFRDQHFFASIEKSKRDLDWEPEFDLISGLADSYNLDFGRGTFRKAADFSTDDMILGKSLVLQS